MGRVQASPIFLFKKFDDCDLCVNKLIHIGKKKNCGRAYFHGITYVMDGKLCCQVTATTTIVSLMLPEISNSQLKMNDVQPLCHCKLL